MLTMSVINPNEPGQALAQLKAASQQNQNDMEYLENNYDLAQPLNRFIYEKLKALEDILGIATNAIQCLQDLQTERDQLEASNQELRKSLNQLSQINMELEEQVELQAEEIREANEQIRSASREHQLLQIEKSIMLNQLQSTKSKLQSTMPKKVSSKQSKPSSWIQTPELANLNTSSSQNLLEGAISNSLQKSIKQKRSIDILRFRGFKLKNKFSQESLQSLSSKWRTPVKLNEDLAELDLVSCQSINQIDYTPFTHDTKQTDEEAQSQSDAATVICRTTQPISVKSCFKLQKPQEVKQRVQKQPLTQPRIFTGIANYLHKLHSFCYNKVVRDRIKPRRNLVKARGSTGVNLIL